MKIKLLLLLAFTMQMSFSQITLENTYTGIKQFNFKVAKIDDANLVYYLLDDTNDQIKIYDTSHNLLSTLTVPSSVRNGRNYIRVNHLTKYLFDNDSEYEYSVAFYNASGSVNYYSCYVLNEDGTILLDGTDFDVNAALGFGDVESQGLVKTIAGDLKFVMVNYNSNSVINECKVYSLPGSFYGLSNKDEVKLQRIGVAPNPTVNKVNTVYHNNLVNGKIIVYNDLGQLIKQISIKKGGLNTKVDLSQFSTGTYYYQVYEGGNKIGAKKVINN